MNDKIPYYILLAGVTLIAVLILNVETNHKLERIKYCRIDSVSEITKDFVPEKLIKYHTNCDLIFSSTKYHQLGDSIEVKTIIIE